MADFRIRYTDEARLLTYAAEIGFVNDKGELIASGSLPDGSGTFFMTGPQRRMVPTGNTVKDRFGNDTPEIADDGYWWRTLRINGNNPFGEGGIPLPDGEHGITIYPPTNPGVEGYVQPEVAVIA